MLRHVAHVRTDIPEEYITSIGDKNQQAKNSVTSNRSMLLRNT
jgi:hypothetical protein